jgi:hypothetical protein
MLAVNGEVGGREHLAPKRSSGGNRRWTTHKSLHALELVNHTSANTIFVNEDVRIGIFSSAARSLMSWIVLSVPCSLKLSRLVLSSPSKKLKTVLSFVAYFCQLLAVLLGGVVVLL